MELNNVYELWERFDNSKADVFELDMQGIHLKLKKNTFNYTNECEEVKKTFSNENLLKENVEEKNKSKEKSNSSLTPVKSPLVGTFYAAAGEGEEPFVKVGQEVKKGDVIGIIEAMKLMNEMVSPCDGVVSEICIENGTMVEYDQILMEIK